MDEFAENVLELLDREEVLDYGLERELGDIGTDRWTNLPSTPARRALRKTVKDLLRDSWRWTETNRWNVVTDKIRELLQEDNDKSVTSDDAEAFMYDLTDLVSITSALTLYSQLKEAAEVELDRLAYVSRRQGLSLSEIGDLIGVSKQATEQRLSRKRRQVEDSIIEDLVNELVRRRETNHGDNDS